MINEIKITDVVEKKAFEQLKNLRDQYQKFGEYLIKLNSQLVELFNVKPSSYGELEKKAKEYADISSQIVKVHKEMASVQKQQVEIYNRLNSVLATLSKNMSNFTDHVTNASKALGESTSTINTNASASEKGAQSTDQYAKSMQDASASISQAKQSYTDIIASIRAYDDSAQDLNLKLTENKTKLEGLKASQKALDSEYKEGKIELADYNKQRAEFINQERELTQQNQQYSALLRTHATVVISTSQSYNEMNAAVLQLEKRFKDLNETQRNGVVGQTMVKQIDELKSELKTIDASLGNYQRNVGNYSSAWNGLNYQFQMIARELPNLGISFQTFIISLSNNIPYLIDELNKARIAHKEYIAQVKAGNTTLQSIPSVLAQSIKSIVNWQTLIIVGVTLLTAYSKEISNWVKELFKSKEVIDANIDSLMLLHQAKTDGVRDSVKEVSQLRVLYRAALDNSRSTEERTTAIRMLKKEYPDYFGLMDEEEIKTGKAAKAYQELTRDIIASAVARRQQALLEGEANKYLDKLGETTKAYQELEKAQKEYDEATEKYNESPSGESAKDRRNAKRDLEDATKDYEKARKESAEQYKIVYNLESSIDSSKIYGNAKDRKEAAVKNREYWEYQLRIAKNTIDKIGDEELKALKKASKEGKDITNLGISTEVVQSYQKALKLKEEAEGKLNIYEDVQKTNAKVEKEEERHQKYMKKLQAEILLATASASEQAYQADILNVETWYNDKLSIIKNGESKVKEYQALSAEERIKAYNGEYGTELELIAKLEKAKAHKIEDITFKYNTEIEKTNIENKLAAIRGNNEKELEERLSLLLQLNEILRSEELKQAAKRGQDLELINKKYNVKSQEITERNLDERLKLVEKNANDIKNENGRTMQEEISLLNAQYRKGEINEKKHQEGLLKIKRDFALLGMQVMIAELEAELIKADKISEEKRKEIQKKIDLLNEQMEAIGQAQHDEETQKWIDSFDKTFSKLISIGKKYAGGFGEIMEGLGDIISDAVQKQGKKFDLFSWWNDLDTKERLDVILSLYVKFSEGITAIAKSIHDAQIERVEEEREANEEEGEKELERIDKLEKQKVISTEEAESLRRQSEEKTAQKDKELQKEKEKIQQRQARWEKTNAVTQTLIATRLAVAKALPNLKLAILVGIMGLAQAAFIAAQPIPKYAKGTDKEGHPGGPAIVGDGGKREIILTKARAYLTPDVPTLVDLPKGAQVIPSIDDIKIKSEVMKYIIRNEEERQPPLSISVDVSSLENEVRETNRLLARMIKQDKEIRSSQDLANYIRSKR